MTTNYDANDIYSDYDPYEGFETIDDTPHPLSHGQFLGHLAGDVDFNLIWRLGEGDRTALDEITDDWRIKERATSIFEHLTDMNYWNEWSKKNGTTND